MFHSDASMRSPAQPLQLPHHSTVIGPPIVVGWASCQTQFGSIRLRSESSSVAEVVAQWAGGAESSVESARSHGPPHTSKSASPSPVQPSLILPWKYRTTPLVGAAA